MNAHTVPTFAEIVATLTAEQDLLLAAMGEATDRKDNDRYGQLSVRWTELGVLFDALWTHKKEVDRKAQCAPVAPVAAAEHGTFVQLDERRQAACMDAAIEVEAIARALPGLVPNGSESVHEQHYLVRAMAGRLLRLASLLMSGLSDDAVSTAHLERVLNLDCGQG